MGTRPYGSRLVADRSLYVSYPPIPRRGKYDPLQHFGILLDCLRCHRIAGVYLGLCRRMVREADDVEACSLDRIDQLHQLPDSCGGSCSGCSVLLDDRKPSSRICRRHRLCLVVLEPSRKADPEIETISVADRAQE